MRSGLGLCLAGLGRRVTPPPRPRSSPSGAPGLSPLPDKFWGGSPGTRFDLANGRGRKVPPGGQGGLVQLGPLPGGPAIAEMGLLALAVVPMLGLFPDV